MHLNNQASMLAKFGRCQTRTPSPGPRTPSGSASPSLIRVRMYATGHAIMRCLYQHLGNVCLIWAHHDDCKHVSWKT